MGSGEMGSGEIDGLAAPELAALVPRIVSLFYSVRGADECCV
jgi:hypothetical protein